MKAWGDIAHLRSIQVLNPITDSPFCERTNVHDNGVHTIEASYREGGASQLALKTACYPLGRG